MRLIDKDVIITEIERRLRELSQLEKASYEIGLYDAYKIVLSFIDTLEVKEVDLEKEIDDAFLENKCNITDNVSLAEFVRIAKHFYELGTRVNNPITATDRGTAEEIIINLKRVENDYHIDLTKQMEWLRNIVKKGK